MANVLHVEGGDGVKAYLKRQQVDFRSRSQESVLHDCVDLHIGVIRQ